MVSKGELEGIRKETVASVLNDNLSWRLIGGSEKTQQAVTWM